MKCGGAMASLIFYVTALLISTSLGHAQLSSNFYEETCPGALDTIGATVDAAVSKEARMGASLIRLHFLDCFVQGCDSSILLNDSATISSEKKAVRNKNSVRGFEVIDDAKAKLEKLCPGVVSCADIVAVAARDSSVALGGPTWTVKLGRRDSTTASMDLADFQIPSIKDSLETLIARFQAKGLSERDLVALSGAHTVGLAHCHTFHNRIYNPSSDIDPTFAADLRKTCPSKTGSGDADTLVPLKTKSPGNFDNMYYTNLKDKKGLLDSDQALLGKNSTATLIDLYSANLQIFEADFASAMIKMGGIDPLTGSAGEVRKHCSVVNNHANG